MPQDLEHWRTKVRDAGLGFADDPITLSLTLALPALFPVRDRRSTEALLTALPGFSAQLYDLHRTVDFLSPVESGDELVREALNAYGEPDRGADVLVGALRAVAAADRPHAVESLCRLASVPGVAAEAADLALAQALTDDPDACLPALAQATTTAEDPARLIGLLRQAFPAASYEVAVDAYLRLPRQDSRLSSAIAQIALDLFARNTFGTETDPADEPSPMLDLDLATRMLDGERPEQAAAFAHRAAGNAHGQDLRVRALVVLSRAVAVLGHHWYAREKADEAVAVARGVGDKGLLFDALQTVVASNHAVRDRERAAAASLEALELSRKLGLEDQAIALGLACAAHTGEPGRAAEFAAESVALLRDLADRDPGRHLPRYIAALDTYATALSAAGQDAFDVGQQALLLIQDLHQRDPGQHGPQYAQVVLNFSNRLAARGDHATALEGYLTATRVLYALVPQSPHAYAARCAIATWSTANAFAALHRWSEAEQAIRGTVTLQRGCVRESQPWVIPDLIDSLEFLKHCLSRAEQLAELPALEAEQQALRRLHARYQTVSGSAAPSPPDG
ncbi:hypothetical protein SAMN04488564_102739 [Lentzea waywayandensis]|uniref:Tetratricopeptide repeat-containing protein n=1 Tax=Lentzea waywayandensis TaxID=84724 RepID=A0A1I6DIU8_9PSEU|nr:hypothetical protein [Lentzea waywayandensis]SFR05272.1 hypothetical protein SAMN04488564_102739 [Lentzea waywayandensis]